MAFKRLHEHDKLQQVIIMMIYREAHKYPKDGKWRKFEGVLKVNSIQYDVNIEFTLTSELFRYKDLDIKLYETKHTIISGNLH